MSEPQKRKQEESFGKRFQKLLEERKKTSGLTLRDLSKELEVSLGVISDWQNEKKTPRADSIIKLSQYFDVSTDYLLGLTDVRSTDSSARAAAEYTGLTEEAIKCLHNPLVKAKTQSTIMLEEEIHDRMSILIEWGILEDLSMLLNDYFDAVVKYQNTLTRWKTTLSDAEQKGTLYEKIYAIHPRYMEVNGKSVCIDFKRLHEYPNEFDEFRRYVDSFSSIDELANYIAKGSHAKDQCDLIQFQIQKLMMEEAQRTEKDALTSIHKENGESNGTDNKENR